jgi:hypothetical protein
MCTDAGQPALDTFSNVGSTSSGSNADKYLRKIEKHIEIKRMIMLRKGRRKRDRENGDLDGILHDIPLPCEMDR